MKREERANREKRRSNNPVCYATIERDRQRRELAMRTRLENPGLRSGKTPTISRQAQLAAALGAEMMSSISSSLAYLYSQLLRFLASSLSFASRTAMSSLVT